MQPYIHKLSWHDNEKDAMSLFMSLSCTIGSHPLNGLPNFSSRPPPFSASSSFKASHEKLHTATISSAQKSHIFRTPSRASYLYNMISVTPSSCAHSTVSPTHHWMSIIYGCPNEETHVDASESRISCEDSGYIDASVASHPLTLEDIVHREMSPKKRLASIVAPRSYDNVISNEHTQNSNVTESTNFESVHRYSNQPRSGLTDHFDTHHDTYYSLHDKPPLTSIKGSTRPCSFDNFLYGEFHSNALSSKGFSLITSLTNMTTTDSLSSSNNLELSNKALSSKSNECMGDSHSNLNSKNIPTSTDEHDCLPEDNESSESLELKYHLSTQSGLSSSLTSTTSSHESNPVGDSVKNVFSSNANKLLSVVLRQPEVQTSGSTSVEKHEEKEPLVSAIDSLSLIVHELNPETLPCHSGEESSAMIELYSQSLLLVKDLGIDPSFALNPSDLYFPSYAQGSSTTVQDPQTLELVKINKGTFCTVYKARYGREIVAVKCPQTNRNVGDESMMRMRSIKEWRILSKLHGHPNILKIFGGVVMSYSDIWIVTEYIDGGDLYSRLYTSDPKLCLSASQRTSVIKQIAFAVAALHSSTPCIVHKDLKINNILLSSTNQVRLCDFGDAEEISCGDSLSAYTAVTWQYASPEVIFSENPIHPSQDSCEKVDIWSLGCIFLELVYQTTPFWCYYVINLLEACCFLDKVDGIRVVNILLFRKLAVHYGWNDVESRYVNLVASISPVEHRAVLQEYLKKEYKTVKFTHQRIRTQLPFHLRTIIESCLSLNPHQRPSAVQIYGYITQHETDIYEEILQLKKT